MQPTFYLVSGATAYLISGQASGLTNNSLRLAAADYVNASGYLMGLFEWVGGGSVLSYTASTSISLWLLQGVTSGTYEDGASGFTPSRVPDVVFPLVSGSLRVTRIARLPPGPIRTLIKNDGTGVTLNGSGVIVSMLPITFQGTSG